MRREFAFALIAILPPVFAAEQPGPPSPPPSANSQPTAQTVYYAGPGVTAPEVLQDSIAVSKPHRCEKLDGAVTLTAIVDVSGVPHDVKSFQENDALLGDFAVKLLEEERFKPGTYNGSPSPVAIEVTLVLRTCMRPAKNAGGAQIALVLKAPTAQWVAPRVASDDDMFSRSYAVGGRVSAPAPIFDPDPHFSTYGRKKRIQGICVLDLTIDANGIPQNVHVAKSLEPSMDQKAIEAVKTWRFKPALKDGTTPVPVAITVEVDFHLY